MKITLVRPTLEMKDAALDYKKEHFDNQELIINGSERFDQMDSYEEWLTCVTENASSDTVHPDWVVTDTFFAIDQQGKIVGSMSEVFCLQAKRPMFIKSFYDSNLPSGQKEVCVLPYQ